MSFTIEYDFTTHPIHDNAFGINYVKIPSRSEIIVPFNIELEADVVILNLESTKGLYLANVIVPKNGNQHIKLLNVTNRPTTVRN